MNAVKIIKEVNDTTIEELKDYYGKKVSIIISPIDDEIKKDSLKKILEIAEKNKGTTMKYKRDELYDR